MPQGNQQRAHSPQYLARPVNQPGGAGVKLFNKPTPPNASQYAGPPVLECPLALRSVLPTHSEVPLDIRISRTPLWEQMRRGQRGGCSLRSVIISWKRKLELTPTYQHGHRKAPFTGYIIHSDSFMLRGGGLQNDLPPNLKTITLCS